MITYRKILSFIKKFLEIFAKINIKHGGVGMLKKKVIIGAVSLCLLAGTGTGVYAYNQKQYEAEQQSLIQKANNAVDNLYNNNHTKLADNVGKKIKSAEIAVGKVEDKKVKAQLSKKIKDVKVISKIQDEVYNTLENGILVESVTDKQLEELDQKLNKIKDINKQIYTNLFNYLSEAESQLIAINSAQNKVNESEQVLNRETYNNALSIVDTLKNETTKNELKARLTAVNEKIVAMEEENRRKEEEVKKAEIVATHQTVDNNQKTVGNNQQTLGKQQQQQSTSSKNSTNLKSAQPVVQEQPSKSQSESNNNEYMNGINSMLDAINKGQTTHVDSGYNNSGNHYDVYEVGN